MGLSGALSGADKKDELDKKKEIITNDLIEIMGIISEKIGQQHGCYVNCKLEVDVIPNEVKK